jgi:hypothetical protein
MPNAFDLVGRIDADTRPFDRKADRVDKRLRKLADSDPTVSVDVDDRRAQADIRSVEQALAGIDDETVGVLADTRTAQADIRSVEAALAGIDDESVTVTGDVDAALGDVQSVEAALAGIEDQSVRVTGDVGDALGGIQSVEAASTGLEDQSIRVTADTQSAQADIQSVEAALAGLEDQTVRVTAQTEGLGSSFGGAGLAARGLGGNLAGAAAGFGAVKAGIAGIIGGGVAAGLWTVAGAASDLGESANVVGINFGSAADSMFAFTADAPRSLGVSTRAANEMAAGVSGLLLNVGFARDETVDWSKRLLTLAADMGSAFNREPVDALAALRSGLLGETEPLKQFNVFLSQAAIQQEALNAGLWDGKGAIDNNAKATATLNIIMRDTARIQGDFANTGTELAGQTRTLTGTWENFRAELGENLVPVLNQAERGLINLLEAGSRQLASAPDRETKWAIYLADLYRLAGDVGGAFTGIRPAANDAGVGVRSLSGALDTAAATAAGTAARQEELKAALQRTRDATRFNTEDQRDLARASQEGAIAARDMDSASRTMANGVDHAGDAARRARDTIDRLKDSLDLLIGVNISAAQADLRFRDALQAVTDAAHKNGRTLDLNTEAGRANSGMLLNAASDALNHVTALHNQGASVRDVSDALWRNREQLVQQAIHLGMTRGEAERYIGSLGFTQANLDRVTGATNTAKGATDSYAGAIRAVPGTKETVFTTPGLAEGHQSVDAFKRKIEELTGGQVNFSVKLLQEHTGRPRGDGPGGPMAPRGGTAINRVRAVLPNYEGLRITSTYRSPAQNRRVGGSPTSYHLDRWNPAVDVAGPAHQLDRLAGALRASGGWREGPLWRTRGHYDHLHVAHEGDVVSSLWPTGGMKGLRHDERPAILQVGEVVVPKMHEGGVVGAPTYVGPLGGETHVHYHTSIVVQGSMVRERDVARQIGRQMAGTARSRGH